MSLAKSVDLQGNGPLDISPGLRRLTAVIPEDLELAPLLVVLEDPFHAVLIQRKMMTTQVRLELEGAFQIVSVFSREGAIAPFDSKASQVLVMFDNVV